MVTAFLKQIGAFDWDVRSGQICWSPGSEAALGTAPGAVSDFQCWSQIVEDCDLKVLRKTVENAAAAHSPWIVFSYRTRAAFGGLSIEGLGRCLYGKDDQLCRIVGTHVDATTRIRREAELLASETRLHSIMATVLDALLIADTNGIIIEASASAGAMFGYAPSEIRGVPIGRLLPFDRAEGDDRRRSHAVRRDGSVFPIERAMAAFGTGEKLILTEFVRDISEQIAAEERLADMGHDLLQVSRLNAMSGLAAGLAHEINQPLGAAANYLGATALLARNGAPRQEIIAAIEQAKSQILRTGHIIRRMRSFVASGDLEMTIVDVAEIFEDALALMLIGSGQYDIRLTCDFPDDAARIFADRIQIQQVVVNIIRNATEELRKGPAGKREINVSSRAIDKNLVETSILDNGPGFQDRILDDSNVGFASTKTRENLGMGLSISRRIIEAHGGQVVLGNRPEGGAAVRFTIPAYAP